MAQRTRLWLISIALFSLPLDPARAQSSDADPESMGARVQACASCHGAQGEGTNDVYIPRLAGKPSGYLFNQLVAFRNGRRKYPPMNYLLEFLTEDYLKKMADYFASRRPPLPQPAATSVSQDVLSRGQALATQGDLKRGLPACSSCHGLSFGGMEPGIPGLLGLRASYLSAQLGAWQYGNRTAIAPDCMQIIAGHLKEEDVKAVAAWLSSQPAPKDLAPAARGSYALPLDCGSEPK